jgi:hypothetical protein
MKSYRKLRSKKVLSKKNKTKRNKKSKIGGAYTCTSSQCPGCGAYRSIDATLYDERQFGDPIWCKCTKCGADYTLK